MKAEAVNLDGLGVASVSKFILDKIILIIHANQRTFIMILYIYQIMGMFYTILGSSSRTTNTYHLSYMESSEKNLCSPNPLNQIKKYFNF